MIYQNISSQKKPDSPLSLHIGERRKHVLGTLQVPEDTGITKSNSYIVCVHYEGEEIPVIPPGVEFVEFSNKDDWVVATWTDIPFDSFQNNYGEAIKKVKDATKLKENWDSYGAESISVMTASRAINFLYESLRTLNNRGITLPKPFTAPCPDGSIQFEWEKESEALEIVIPHNIEDKISFLQIKGDDYKEGFIDHLSELVEYFL